MFGWATQASMPAFGYFTDPAGRSMGLMGPGVQEPVGQAAVPA